MSRATFTVDMSATCPECGKKGVCDNGLCIACTILAMFSKSMKSAEGRAAHARFAKHADGKDKP